MKAIVLRANGDPPVLKLEEWPDPKPQPHEVLVKVGAVGVPFHDIVERNEYAAARARSAENPWQRNRGHCHGARCRRHVAQGRCAGVREGFSLLW